MIDLKSSIRNLYNYGFDRWLGIATLEKDIAKEHDRQRVGNLHWPDAIKYVPTDYLLLMIYLHEMRLTRNDVLFDIGCGAGRFVCFAARHQIKKCIGIDYDERLLSIARSNVATMRGRHAEVEIRLADAATADYSAGTVFYFYNPFGERTMTAVIDAIGASVSTSPRDIRIVYAMPEFERSLANCGWLERYALRQYPFVNAPVSFWRNRRA
jgi:predicted RNA methylase